MLTPEAPLAMSAAKILTPGAATSGLSNES